MLEHKNKPTLVVTPSFALYMGNPSTEEMVIESGELFGFNIGNFEQKIVTGSEFNPMCILLHCMSFNVLRLLTLWCLLKIHTNILNHHVVMPQAP